MLEHRPTIRRHALVSPEKALKGVGSLLNELFDAGITPMIVSTKGGTPTLEGEEVSVSRTYLTARSVEFDAVVVINPPAIPAVTTMLGEFERHKKAIVLAGDDAPAALDTAGVAVKQPGILAVASLRGGCAGRGAARFPPRLGALVSNH